MKKTVSLLAGCVVYLMFGLCQSISQSIAQQGTLPAGLVKQPKESKAANTVEHPMISLSEKMIQAAMEAQACEKELLELEKLIDPMEIKEVQALEKVQELQKKLSILLREARHRAAYTPVVALLSAQSPGDYIHVQIALKSLIVSMDRRNEPMINALKSLANTRKEIAEKKELVTKIRTRLNAAAKDITRLQAEKKNFRKVYGETGDMFAGGMFASMKKDSRLKKPVVGLWESSFDSTLPAHILYKQGSLVTTRSQALVTSPISGKISMAGPMTNRVGNAIIVERGEKKFLLFGVGSIFCHPGDIVNCGEPVARMPAQISDGENKKRPKLYIEVWQGGQLVNPSLVFKE